MKSIGRGLALALVAFSLGVCAQTSSALPGGHGPDAGHKHGGAPGAGMPRQAEHLAARLQTLETALNLQPNQKAAFDVYANRLKAEAQARVETRKSFHEEMQALKGDRQALADRFVAMAQRRAQTLGEINELRKSLVAVLTLQQVTVLDQQEPGPGMAMMMEAPGKRGPGHGMKHRGGAKGRGGCGCD